MPGGISVAEGAMAQAMQSYNEGVIRDVPAERLLVWTVADGWEPLAAFLDVPVPPMPFPRLNDTREFIDRVIDGSLSGLQAWWADLRIREHRG
jgi:hypothetical protein